VQGRLDGYCINRTMLDWNGNVRKNYVLLCGRKMLCYGRTKEKTVSRKQSYERPPGALTRNNSPR